MGRTRVRTEVGFHCWRHGADGWWRWRITSLDRIRLDRPVDALIPWPTERWALRAMWRAAARIRARQSGGVVIPFSLNPLSPLPPRRTR